MSSLVCAGFAGRLLGHFRGFVFSHVVNKACQILPKDADFPKLSLRA